MLAVTVNIKRGFGIEYQNPCNSFVLPSPELPGSGVVGMLSGISL